MRTQSAAGRLVTLAISLTWVSVDCQAVPTDSAFGSVPSRFQTTELTLGSRALGEICFSRDMMPDGDVCNPAFLPEQSENILLGRAFVGNGYTALSTADQFIYQPLTKDFLQHLFQNQNITSVEAHLGLAFSSRYFSAGFSPYRVQYLSEVHNPNLPVVAVHAAIERSFQFSGGMPLEWISPSLQGFTLGAKARIFRRSYVHGSFSLFQAISDDPRNLLPAQEQNVVYVDPSIGWTSRSLGWKPRASVAVTRLGKSWPEDPLYPQKTDLALGFGIEPPLSFGRLRLGLDATDLFTADTFFSRFRFGGSYKFGMMEIMSGINDHSLTGGVEFAFQFIEVGIVYEFIRDDVESTNASARVSTEFVLRL